MGGSGEEVSFGLVRAGGGAGGFWREGLKREISCRFISPAWKNCTAVRLGDFYALNLTQRLVL